MNESSIQIRLTKSELRIISNALSRLATKMNKLTKQAIRANLVDVSNWVDCNDKLKLLQEKIREKYE